MSPGQPWNVCNDTVGEDYACDPQASMTSRSVLHQIQPDDESVGNERGLTRDGTAEPVSRGQILRRERGREENIIIFLVQLTTSRICNRNARLIHILLQYD